MLASVTRLRVRGVRFLPAFLWRTFLSLRQVGRASGFAGGRLMIDAHWTFWTLTVWESEKDESISGSASSLAGHAQTGQSVR